MIENNISKENNIQKLINSFNNKNFHESKKIALDLLKLFPDDYLINKILGFLYFQDQKYESAISNFEIALKSNIGDEELLFNLGVCNQKLSNFNKSYSYYKRLLKLFPDHINGIFNLSILYKENGDFKESEELLLKIISVDANNYNAHLNLSILYIHTGKIIDSIKYLNICVKLNPNDHKTYNNLGISYKALGDFKLAEINFKKALKLKKDFANAHYNLSLIKNYKPDDPQLELLNNLLKQREFSNNERFHFLFALAKIYQDNRDYSNSFKAYFEANNICKNLFNYNYSSELEKFKNIKYNFNLLKKIKLKSNEKINLEPIFIIGMPRSGSTLVEQIISAHSLVTAGGELNYISKFSSEILNNSNIDSKSLENLKNKYYSELKKHTKNKSFITDKNLLNFKFIGIILKTFPNAKIIHTTRNPSSICWSIYTKYFPNKALGFSYSLNDIVSYYKLYKNLMDYWYDNFPNKIYELKYENLINDQRNETINLIKYLNLSWENDCLYPEKNKQIVMTASDQQIREPIHKKNISSWKNFLPYIESHTKFFDLI